MTRAVTNRETHAYIPEVTWGTTPTGSPLILTRFTGFSPKQDKETTESAEINGRRAIQDLIAVKMRGGFTLPFELSAGVLDAFMPMLIGQADWATDILTMGNTRGSLSWERQLAQIGKYWLFAGAIPSKLSLSVALGRIIGGSWDFASKFPVEASSTAGTGAPTAAPTGAIMNPISHVQLVQEGATPIKATEATIEIANGLLDFEELGNIDPADLDLGDLSASGKVTMHLEDAAYFTKYRTHALTSFHLKLGGASSANYLFEAAKVRLKAWDAPNQGRNGKIMQTFDWVAVDDATDGPIKVTRAA